MIKNVQFLEDMLKKDNCGDKHSMSIKKKVFI